MGDGRENYGVRRLSVRPRDTVSPLSIAVQRANPFTWLLYRRLPRALINYIELGERLTAHRLLSSFSDRELREPYRFRFWRPPPAARLPFHQIGQPPRPLYLCPLEQDFQPPLLASGISRPAFLAFTSTRSTRAVRRKKFPDIVIISSPYPPEKAPTAEW